MRPRKGFASLLNVTEQPHWTVFFTDFDLAPADVARIRGALKSIPTRLVFLQMRRTPDIARSLRKLGGDLVNDYFSLQTMLSHGPNRDRVDVFFRGLTRRDLGRIEIPWRESGFVPSFASYLLRIVMRSNYGEQDVIWNRFSSLLEHRVPYEVRIETGAGKLTIRDLLGWFRVAGRFRAGENRDLPGGEVTYVGEQLDGIYLVDGALLPTAQWPSAANEAKPFQPLSRTLAKEPFALKIRDGRVSDVTGRGKAARAFAALFDRDSRYRDVTEVGLSFNSACRKFVHSWPAASNETRPGVHIGLGGGGNVRNGAVPVHIDCITTNCRVFVNGHPFLRTTS